MNLTPYLTPWRNRSTWDPFREIEEMGQRLERTIARQLPEVAAESFTMSEWTPRVDIKETATAFQIKAELPEVEKKDVHVQCKNGVLTLQGERRKETEKKDERFHLMERAYGSFLRQFTLPDNVDESRIAAAFKDGILSVNLPKASNGKAQATEVPIQ